MPPFRRERGLKLFYLFGQGSPNKPYETIIGITAATEAEAAARLADLIGEKATAFELYDTVI